MNYIMEVLTYIFSGEANNTLGVIIRFLVIFGIGISISFLRNKKTEIVKKINSITGEDIESKIEKVVVMINQLYTEPIKEKEGKLSENTIADITKIAINLLEDILSYDEKKYLLQKYNNINKAYQILIENYVNKNHTYTLKGVYTEACVQDENDLNQNNITTS